MAEAARTQRVPVTPLGRVPLRNVREPVDLFSLELASDMPAAVDPVCLMRVSPDSAAGQLRVAGVEYWFCSLQCAGSFLSNPEAYRRSLS